MTLPSPSELSSSVIAPLPISPIEPINTTEATPIAMLAIVRKLRNRLRPRLRMLHTKLSKNILTLPPLQVY